MYSIEERERAQHCWCTRDREGHSSQSWQSSATAIHTYARSHKITLEAAEATTTQHFGNTHYVDACKPTFHGS